jgi:hypothetical protein
MGAQALDCNHCHELFTTQEDLDEHRLSKHQNILKNPVQTEQSGTAGVDTNPGSFQTTDQPKPFTGTTSVPTEKVIAEKKTQETLVSKKLAEQKK